MYAGGRLEHRVGPRLTALLGGIFVCGSTILASTGEPVAAHTLDTRISCSLTAWSRLRIPSQPDPLYPTARSLLLLLLIYGVGFGVGIGLTYVAPLMCGYRWDPDRKGLVSGWVLAGFGAGALVFNQVRRPRSLVALRADVESEGDLILVYVRVVCRPVS
jgi:MFS family permease